MSFADWARVCTLRARFWLDRNVDALGWALSAPCWTPNGELLVSTEGLACLQRIQTAIRRLVFADRLELLAVGEPIVIKLARVIGDVAHARFDAVRALLDTNPARPWEADSVLWKASRELSRAN